MGSRLSNEQFRQQIYDLTGDEFEFQDDYQGCKTPLPCLHKYCGQTFTITPDNLRKKINKRKRTHEHLCPSCRHAHYHHQFSQQMGSAHFCRHVEVRCDYKHRLSLPLSDVPAFQAGKIACPICQRLHKLDPQYKDAIVDFTFEKQLRKRDEGLL